MGVLGIIILVFFIISALLLVGFVLIQDEGGDGLGGIFGGGNSAMMGNRSGNILTRITTVLGVIFFVTCLSFALYNNRPSADRQDIIESVQEDSEEEGKGLSPDWWKSNKEVEDSESRSPAPEMGAQTGQ